MNVTNLTDGQGERTVYFYNGELAKNLYTAGLLFSRDFKVVVLILKDHPAWQKDRYNGIGGKFEGEDETFAHTQAREFYEEIRVLYGEQEVEILDNKWEPFCIVKGENEHYDPDRPGSFAVTWFYAVADFDGVLPKESEVPKMFSVNNIPENAISNIRWLVQMAIARASGKEKTVKIYVISEAH